MLNNDLNLNIANIINLN